MDWKDALKNLHDSGTLPEGETPQPAPEPAPVRREKLRIVIDKKQRHGKVATIIEGFQCSDEELKEIAKSLKQRIGTGGSCRAGEILLQGDWRDKASDLLRQSGYRL